MGEHGRLTIVGCGPGGVDDLTMKAVRAVNDADVVAGPDFLLEMFPDVKGEKRPINADVAQVLKTLGDEINEKKVALLVTGDPGMRSLARGVVKNLGAKNVNVVPGISSVQAACAKIGRPWDDLSTVSFHGAPAENENRLIAEMIEKIPCAVLTDPKHRPEWVAQKLLERGREKLRLSVCSDMGRPSEKITVADPAEAAGQSCSALSIVVIEEAE